MSFPSIFEQATVNQLVERINQLSPITERKWGKMSVNQMLEHQARVFSVALGEEKMKVPFLLKIVGPFLKNSLLSDKDFGQNGPTPKGYVVADEPNFEEGRTKLIRLLQKYSSEGITVASSRKHDVFGKLTGEEWSTLMYKHTDHHLRQFGV
jgi:hypothetical protein